jgi:hypothetical protein
MPLADTAPLQRTPERAALALAIATRARAGRDLEQARCAVDRGRDALAAAEARLQDATAATAAAAQRRAAELQRAADLGTAAPASTTSRVRAAEAEAEEEVEASRTALAGLRGHLAEAEDALHAANALVIGRADAVIRSAMVERALADALEAAAKLKGAQLLLRFLMHPEEAGVPVAINRVLPGPFGPSDDDDRRLGSDRAWRRRKAVEAARLVRDEPLDGELAAAIKEHLDFSLQCLFEAGRRWTVDSDLGPWIAARNALMEDADTPLPQV